MSIRIVPRHPGGGCVLRFAAGQRPACEAAAPAIAASLRSRLRQDHPCQRRCLRLEAERHGRHENGHALLPDRSPARQPDVGYRRNSRQRLQGWRLAPEAQCLHGRSPAAPAARRNRLQPGQHHVYGALPLPSRSRRHANLFAGSTWIVQKGDRDPILAPRPANPPPIGRVPDPQFFEGLANAKTILLNNEDHDVFGDGTVVVKSTPGHTPGHQALFLKLAKTEDVLLSGDLYHYPEEITFKKFRPSTPARNRPRGAAR